jgi:hypothetical protein
MIFLQHGSETGSIVHSGESAQERRFIIQLQPFGHLWKGLVLLYIMYTKESGRH